MMSNGPEKQLETELLCNVIREPEFEEQAMSISKNYQRLDDLDQAIDWALARFFRSPEIFYLIEDDKYLYKTDKIYGFPQLRILFSVDEDLKTIKLLSIQEIQ